MCLTLLRILFICLLGFQNTLVAQQIVDLEEGSEILLKIEKDLHWHQAKAGDTIRFRMANHIVSEDVLIAAIGTQVMGILKDQSNNDKALTLAIGVVPDDHHNSIPIRNTPEKRNEEDAHKSLELFSISSNKNSLIVAGTLFKVYVDRLYHFSY